MERLPLIRLLLSRFIAALAALAVLPAPCQDQSAVAAISSSPRRTQWLDRPWELRYFFYVTDNWGVKKDVASESATSLGPGNLDRSWPEIFKPTHFFRSHDRWAKPDDGLSVVIIDFERNGMVKTPNTFSRSLRGRLDSTLRVSIAAGDPFTEPRFRLGEWFMGLGDASTHWAPGLCGVSDMPSPFSQTDTGYLYGPKFIIGRARPSFGCREWAYQLNDPARPYIDITSYIPKRVDPDGPGTYIRDTIGWSGFDEHKPIIGKHESDWYCLHECPAGQAPGLIPDIKAWAAKNGWPVPRAPTRVPTFPDPPARSGTYPQ